MEGHVERMRRIWGATAGEWDRQRAVISDIAGPVTAWLVEHLDPRPGETVLELGAGPGTDTGLAVAERLGATGRLVCSDLVPEMVEAARREGDRRGLTNVEYRVVDAQAPDLPDAGFDAVLARWVYQLVPDPLAALRGARRLLRSDGRLASSCWTGEDDNPFDVAVLSALAPWRTPPAPAGNPPELHTPEGLSAALRAAGFRDVLVERVPVRMRAADDAACWAIVTGLFGGSSDAVARLDPDDRDAVRRALLAALEPYRTAAGGYDVPGCCLNAFARV